MLEAVWRDLTHGARLLVKNPGFSFVAVLSIAIGVGVNAAMFSMADALLLRPLQVPRASDVVAVSATTPQEGAGALRNRWLSYRDYVDPRDRARSFTSLGAFQVLVTSVATGATEPARIALTMSRVMSLGAAWAGMRMPPITRSAAVQYSSMAPAVE